MKKTLLLLAVLAVIICSGFNLAKHQNATKSSSLLNGRVTKVYFIPNAPATITGWTVDFITSDGKTKSQGISIKEVEAIMQAALKTATIEISAHRTETPEGNYVEIQK